MKTKIKNTKTTTLKEIATSIGCSHHTLRPYLGRGEFSNIEIIKGIIYNITEDNIERMKELVYSRSIHRKAK